MNYDATIKWLDTDDIQDVIVTTDDIHEDDDNIFFYFDSEDEIKEYMKVGVHEFIILESSKQLR